MSDSNKRKANSGFGDGDRNLKRSKGGNASRWKTPHRVAKETAAPKRGFDRVQFGDQGIFITCVRGKEGRAVEEARGLFEEYTQMLYNTTMATSTASQASDGNESTAPNSQRPTEVDDEEEEEDIDIESSIAAELSTLAQSRKPVPDPNSSHDPNSFLPVAQPIFTSIHIDIQCIAFFQTRPPVTSTVDFVTRICKDAASASAAAANGNGSSNADGGLSTGETGTALKIRTRYLNRLTPMSCMGRATEKGLIDVARKVLRDEGFVVKGDKEEQKTDVMEGKEGGDNLELAQRDSEPGKVPEKKWTYAIRPSIRAHKRLLTRDVVIKNIASLIDEKYHKVDLTHPDKIILVEVLQNICGMAVVDGRLYDGVDIDGKGGGGLKKFNLWELWNGGLGEKGRDEKKEDKKQTAEEASK